MHEMSMVDRVLNGYFFLLAHFSYDMKHAISTRLFSKYKSRSKLLFLVVFEAHMNILFIIEATILVLVKWSYRSPQLC